MEERWLQNPALGDDSLDELWHTSEEEQDSSSTLGKS